MGHTYVLAFPGNDDIFEKTPLPQSRVIVSTLLHAMRAPAEGMASIIAFICCRSKLLARRPVEKIAVTLPETAKANAATNIATAVVLPKRRGVIAMNCCLLDSMPCWNIPSRMFASLSMQNMRCITDPAMPRCSCFWIRDRCIPKQSSMRISSLSWKRPPSVDASRLRTYPRRCGSSISLHTMSVLYVSVARATALSSIRRSMPRSSSLHPALGIYSRPRTCAANTGSMSEHACEMPIPRLQNIVATFCTLPQGQAVIDLELLVSRCPFMEFNSKRFAAVVIRLARPKTTCLLFASGKAVCTGAKNESAARTACLKYVNLLCLSGVRFRFMSFKVENIVAAVHCPFRIDLNQMAECVSGWVNYEPSLFPGLIFRKALDCRKKSTKRNTLVFICFQSGKCIITGGHSREQVLTEWIKFFNEILTEYVSQIDYGSSGNYRVVQSAFSKCRQDLDMFKSICYFERNATRGQAPPEASSELLDLKRNQNRQSNYSAAIVAQIMRPVAI